MSSPTAISSPLCVYSFVCTRCNQLSSSQSVVRRTSPAHYHSPNWQSVTGRVPPISAVVINKSADVFVGEREGEETRAEQSQWTSQLLWISLTSLSLSEWIAFIQLCVPSVRNFVFLIGNLYSITSHFINHQRISLNLHWPFHYTCDALCATQVYCSFEAIPRAIGWYLMTCLL